MLKARFGSLVREAFLEMGRIIGDAIVTRVKIWRLNVTGKFDVVILQSFVSKTDYMSGFRAGTYCKFAKFTIVNAEKLICFADTQLHRCPDFTDHFNAEKDDNRTAERISEARNRIKKLYRKLNIVMVEPAAWNVGRAIEMSDVISARKLSMNFSA